MSIIAVSVAMRMAKETMIFMGNPITKRLNCGMVFISIPNITSASHPSAVMGKAIIKPTKNMLDIA